MDNHDSDRKIVLQATCAPDRAPYGGMIRSRASIMRRKAGYTLMEVILVLGIVAIVMAGAFALYNTISGSTNDSQVQNQLKNIESKVRSLFAANGGRYTGLTDDQSGRSLLINSNAVQSNMYSDDDGSTPFFHAYGGAVRVEATNNDGSSGGVVAFTVTFEEVPQGGCLKLAQQTGSLRDGVRRLTIGGTAITTLPPTVMEANQACSAELQDMAWTFN